MVAAFVWGPMKWRMMHGLAYLYDHVRETIVDDNGVFHNYMVGMAGILPCQECRTYCKALFRRDAKKFRDMATGYGGQTVAFEMHNIVNRKLDRPEIESQDLVMRRSRMWNNEFTVYGMFGFLFVIALNYNKYVDEEGGSRAADTVEKAYRNFFEALAYLLRYIGMEKTAISMHTCMAFDSSMDLFYRVYQEYLAHGFNDDIYELQQRYSENV